jgi:hypothetical protein
MRAFCVLAAIGAASGFVLDAMPAGAVCSVFDQRPCAPTVCSVFQRQPCVPEIESSIGQDSRLTIKSAASEQAKHSVDSDDIDPSTPELDTLGALFDALRSCWIPPPEHTARPGMEMSVRLAFKRNGDVIAPPRVTYVSPNAPPSVRESYFNAIIAALDRCTPLRFSAELGGALAGRPIAIRFIDDRVLHPTTE